MKRVIGGVLAASFSMALAACSGTAAEPTFDTDEADDLAMKMLPDPAVLPGHGWRVVSENDFADSDTDFLEGVEECDEVRANLAKFNEFDERERRGRGARDYEVGLPGGRLIEVEMTSDIYSSIATLVSGTEVLEAAFANDAYSDCFVAYLESQEDETTKIDADRHTAAVPAPRKGWHGAIGFTTAGPEASSDEYFELYVWRVGNALMTVTVSGPRDQITEDFVKTLLARVDGSALVAARNR